MSGFYSTAEWSRIRKRQLARCPMCVSCEKAAATEVDHIVPITDGGAKRDRANLQSLCKPCHSAKTTAQRRGDRWIMERHRWCDASGWPRDPAHPWNAKQP